MTNAEIVRMLEDLVWLGLDDDTIAAMVVAGCNLKIKTATHKRRPQQVQAFRLSGHSPWLSRRAISAR